MNTLDKNVNGYYDGGFNNTTPEYVNSAYTLILPDAFELKESCDKKNVKKTRVAKHVENEREYYENFVKEMTAFIKRNQDLQNQLANDESDTETQNVGATNENIICKVNGPGRPSVVKYDEETDHYSCKLCNVDINELEHIIKKELHNTSEKKSNEKKKNETNALEEKANELMNSYNTLKLKLEQNQCLLSPNQIQEINVMVFEEWKLLKQTAFDASGKDTGKEYSQKPQAINTRRCRQNKKNKKAEWEIIAETLPNILLKLEDVIKWMEKAAAQKAATFSS